MILKIQPVNSLRVIWHDTTCKKPPMTLKETLLESRLHVTCTVQYIFPMR